MATYTHGTSGVKVSVADGKELGPEWVPETDEDKKPRSPRGKKTDES
ncbi:hypothetical protein [Microbacterium sp. 1P06AB]